MPSPPRPPPPSNTEPLRVVINARPLLPFESAQNAVSSLSHRPSPPFITLHRRHAPDAHFSQFDAVYFPSNAQPPDVLYRTHVQPLLQSLFDGLNATVFAYGQTSAGKSYTMDHITARIANQLFQLKQVAEKEERAVTIRVGFVEIYKEHIRDLIDANCRNAVPVHVRERRVNAVKHVFLDGAKERCVQNAESLATIIRDAAIVRQTAATAMNASSSRSHSVITITIQQEYTQSKSNNCLFSKLHLVDLAGSERVKRTAAQGTRFEEGVQINKGLFALAKVISALANKVSHVPYRDSKLTRLLQDSLGGNAKTLLIACISPADNSCEETLGTLRYAARAKRIHNKPVVNTEPDSAEMSDLRAALARARAQIATLVAENDRLRRTPKPFVKSINHSLASPSLGGPPCNSPRRSDSLIVTRDDVLMSELKCRVTELESVLERHGIALEQFKQSPLRKIHHVSHNGQPSKQQEQGHEQENEVEREGRAPKRRPRAMPQRIPKATSFGSDCGEKEESIGRVQSERMLRPPRRAVQQFGQESEEEQVEQDGYEDVLESKVVNMLSTFRIQAMRHTFRERLRQVEEDKIAMNDERLKLVKRLSSIQRKYEKEMEELRNNHQSQMLDLRSKVGDIKKVEADRVRMWKKRENSDAMRKKMMLRAEAAERGREESVTRLSDVVNRFETMKRSLSKENRELARNERGLKIEMNRLKTNYGKQQASMNRLEMENESMRRRLRECGRQTMRRTTSGLPPRTNRTRC